MEMSTSLRPGSGGAARDFGQLPGTRLSVAMERSASVDGRSTVWVGKTWEIHGKMPINGGFHHGKWGLNSDNWRINNDLLFLSLSLYIYTHTKANDYSGSIESNMDHE